MITLPDPGPPIIWLMRIDLAKPADYAEIDHLLREAFSTDGEAWLVNKIRQDAAERGSRGVIELVACGDEADGEPDKTPGRCDGLVGYCMLSPVTVETGDDGADWLAAGVGPIAVDAERRRRGIGGALVREALDRARRNHIPAVFVLGDPDYWRRFGFRTAAEFGFEHTFDAPPEAFMVVSLRPRAIDPGWHGRVRYHEAFDGLG